MNMISAAALMSSSLLLGACAHLPDAQLGYFLPETTVKITALRTMACSSDGDVFVVTTITPSTSNAAPRDGTGYVQIDLNKLRGAFSDASAKLQRYEDGRLQSWNSSAKGRGEEIIKSALTLATVATGGTVTWAGAAQTPCDLISSFGKDGVLSISYSTTMDVNAKSQPLRPDPKSQDLLNALAQILPEMTITSKPVYKPAPPVSYVRKPSNDPVIEARQPGMLYLDVNDAKGALLWSGSVLVAQLGTPYPIPIPKPALFGQLTLSAEFSESGALNHIEYVNTNGASEFANSLATLSKATSGETSAEKATEAKNEADLIYQQQRLVLCKASPSTCK